jgi:DNA-binding HxlR family transcriptional regulator
MRVQVIQRVSYAYKGKKYTFGEIIENYEGALDKYIRRIPDQKETETQKPNKKETKDVLMQTESEVTKPIIKTKEGTEVLATFSEDLNLSPEMIKAKIAEVESSKVVVKEEVEEPEENVKKEYNVVEVARGWYEVQDENGEAVGGKKMRRDDAEALLEELYA